MGVGVAGPVAKEEVGISFRIPDGEEVMVVMGAAFVLTSSEMRKRGKDMATSDQKSVFKL